MANETDDVKWNNGMNETAWRSLWMQTFQPFRHVNIMIWKIGSPIVLLPGIFGNIMIILIMHRFSKTNLSIFFQVLAVSDLLVLTTGLFPNWLHEMFGTQYVEDLGSLSCKVSKVIIFTTGAVSPWMLVALTMQRAASVLWPHRMNAVWTKRKLRAIAIALIVFFTLIHCHFFYGWDIDVKLCKEFILDCCPAAISEMYAWFYLIIWTWVILLEFSLLPFVMLIISNSVLIWKLITSVREAGRQLTVGQCTHQSREKKVSSLTVTLLAVSVCFFLLTTPIMLYFILQPRVFSSNIAYRNPVLTGQYFVYWAVSNILWYSNSAVNFYLYCLTGTKFRAEFQKIIWELFSCFQKKQNGRVRKRAMGSSAITSSSPGGTKQMRNTTDTDTADSDGQF